MKTTEFLDQKELTDKIIAIKSDGKVKSQQILLSDILTEYAKQKCKEQREICSRATCDKGTTRERLYTDDVLNAPEPKFD